MSKYHAVPTFVNGTRFASKAEAARYADLLFLERNGNISALETHPSYDLKVNGHLICRYAADFRYYQRCSGRHTVEDLKGVKTAVYRIKKKLMLAIHGIEILETGVRR